MPDPRKQTISASQAAALFNASPYLTRWMLWKWFAHDVVPPTDESTRMYWGKTLQTPILQYAAKQLNLQIVENFAHGHDLAYARRGFFGATRDATVWDPVRGVGCVEVKCVFEYKIWMDDWRGGEMIPRAHEIQLQTGMYVGPGDNNPFSWGLLVAWVCGGELVYFYRDCNHDLWAKLEIEAGRFFHSLEEKREPEVFGNAIELPWITKLFETRKGDITDRSDDTELLQALKDWNMHKGERARHNKMAESLRAKLLGAAKETELVTLPEKAGYRVIKAGTGKSIKPFGIWDDGAVGD